MIILSREEIEAVVDPNEMMDTIEEAYRIFGENEFYMPERPVVEHENKTLMYMPCYTKEGIGTKILSIFPENAKLGLPSIDGVVLLNDQKTGAGRTVGYRMEDGSGRRRGHPPSVQKGLPYSRNRGSGGTGISPCNLCLCGQGYPKGVCIQSQRQGFDKLS